ncbi:MAG TPA: protease pro-enzyme activation domain-containing protein, partial [Rhizomicrobium sp.]
MQKLKTALYGAAMTACLIAVPAMANPQVSMAGPAAATATVHFDVLLPLRHKDKLEALLKAQQDPNSAQFHKWLTPAQFATQFGADKGTLESVAKYLQSRGFAVKVQTRSVSVTGTAGHVDSNFGVQLRNAQSAAGSHYIMTNESVRLPKELASAGAQIFSFAPHVSQVFSHATPLTSDRHKKVDNRYGDVGPYWFDDLKQAYQYPAATDTVTVNGKSEPLNGKGATIAALMSSDVLDSDIQALFDHEQWTAITGASADPALWARVNINGGAPFQAGSGASLEASLDVQQELTGAPGANVVLYNIPSLSDGDIITAYLDIDEQDAVDLVSMSFGECELFYFPKYNGGQDYRGIPIAEHELFMQGNSEGITFLASSGDSAGEQCPSPAYFTGGPSRFKAGLQVPADDPNVTAVGGTNLVTTSDGTLNSAYVSENAWDDPEIPYDPYGVGVDVKGGEWGAGSGYSALWPAPDYQSLVNTGSKMRAVPDIGMQVGGCPGGIAKLHHGVCNGGNDPKNGNGNSQRSAAVVGFGVNQGGGFYGVI